MKNKIIAMAAAVAFLGIGSSAYAAGQGGITGAAAFVTDGAGVVTEASAAVAVGKSDAVSGAISGVGTEAFAAGTSGAVTMAPGAVYIQTIASDTNLGVAQGNDLSGSETNIDVAAGTVNGVQP
jgi:hypothetical protein